MHRGDVGRRNVLGLDGEGQSIEERAGKAEEVILVRLW